MPIVNFTDAAVKEFKRIYTEQALPDTTVLVIGVRGGGCSGFQHVLNMVEDVDPAKNTVEVVNGLRVAVDKRSAIYLDGTTVDFHDELNKRGFVFENPGIKGKCGCGSSFSV